jgi:hypothetical protein
MPKPSFICHSSEDADIAKRLVSRLENASIPCWIAPRNIPPGLTYAASIVQGIKAAGFFIFIFTKASNQSEAVINEIENAMALKIPVIPFRIDNIAYSDSLDYYLRSKQAINAYSKSLDAAIDELITYIHSRTGTTAPSIPKTPLATPEGPRKRPIFTYVLAGAGVLLLAFFLLKFLNPKSNVQTGGGQAETTAIKPPDTGTQTSTVPECQPETPDFANGSTTVFQANLTTLGSQKNEHGNVQPSQFGNVYEMEAYSNTWIGFPAPDYFIKMAQPLEGNFLLESWFNIKEGSPVIQYTLADDGASFYAFHFYVELWENAAPTFTSELGYTNNGYAQMSKQFANRQKIPACVVSKINLSGSNHIAVKRENETVTFYLNNYPLQTFQSAVFPVRKIAVGLAFKSKVDISSIEAKIAR